MQKDGNDKSLPTQSAMSLLYILSFWFPGVQVAFYLIDCDPIIPYHKGNPIWFI